MLRPGAARPREVAATLVLLAAPATALVAFVTLRDRVPDPVPSHWGASGRVDAVASLTTYTTVIAVVSGAVALIGVVLLVALGDRPGRGGAVATAGATGWLLASAYVGTLVVSTGAARAEDVGVSPAMVAALVIVPGLVALLLVRVTPGSRAGIGDVDPPPSALRLRPGQEVDWRGGASSRGLLAAGVVLLVAGGASALLFWPATPGLVVIGLALIWTHTLAVRVDRVAVTVAWGPLGWPQTVVPLREIAGAEARDDLDPLAWGGWGYRVRGDSRAAVVRRGPGLVLERRAAVPFAVTVDDPTGAAELINALLSD